MIYSDSDLSFEDLLDTEKSVLIHINNLPILAKNMLKVSKNLFVAILNKIFKKRL